MIKREYIIALNRAVESKNKFKSSESIKESSPQVKDSKKVKNTSSIKIPDACPSNMIPFENKIVNKVYVPSSLDKTVDEEGRAITEYARFQIKDYDLILEALENGFHELPSLILGPEKGYVTALYVGSTQSALNGTFIDKHNIKRILLCTLDPRLTSEHYEVWDKILVGINFIELDMKKFEEPTPSFWDKFCCSARDQDFLAEQIKDRIEWINDGRKEGGVLLVDMDGFTYAPAMASIYLAVTKRISFSDAFHEVKLKRHNSAFPESTQEALKNRLPHLTGIRPEKAPQPPTKTTPQNC